jgi:hypothetical protein
MQTKRTQFGVDGQMASLLFHLYGYPPAKEVSVFPVDNKTEITQINDIKIKTATVLDSFHDVVIHAIGYTINFEFDRLNETDARSYTIIAYNSYGKSKFDFEIIPASVGTFFSCCLFTYKDNMLISYHWHKLIYMRGIFSDDRHRLHR